jgi:hypothetical protein
MANISRVFGKLHPDLQVTALTDQVSVHASDFTKTILLQRDCVVVDKLADGTVCVCVCDRHFTLYCETEVVQFIEGIGLIKG